MRGHHAAATASTSTSKAGALNAVPNASASTLEAQAADAAAEPKFCAIDDPGCEACQ